MNIKSFPLFLFGSAWLIWGGPSLLAGGSTALDNSGSFSALMQDLGPEGIYVDVQGHDKNDSVVGSVSYNNQSKGSIHIQAIYVHGKNIKTQGLFPVNVDIEVGAKVKLLDVLRDKIGEPSTVAVEVHYQ